MCGRYAITSSPEAIRELLGYMDQPNFPKRYNVAPTQPIPIVRIADGRRRFALVRWGLIPSWVKDPRTFMLLINARGESLKEKPAFRAAIRHRRCLIPADGFYEWRQAGTHKQPYYIYLKSGGPFAFAGLWESWHGPNGEETESGAIVTTHANALLAPLHARMPVIVEPAAYDLWLDCQKVDADTASALIMPAREGLLAVHPVSIAVNRVTNDDARLIEPVAENSASIEAAAPQSPAATAAKKLKRAGRQGSLF
ncbi:MAG: SOS response-associated peptidase [Rhizobiales bacterium]|nr:SOS response-associated peptidase [Hyphomicrobiales bacterium]